ncbi:type II secretion system protein N [Shimia haliotis]|uniref:Type II secretion system protein GspC N-terminal domain-containing protein n=1 Tax=Shimia haliotis TaxID=1280847 RepID=A0A1I4EH31_9RHOB|nr:type II secretion system protein N [Shimia haliotis]SFL05062.1 hypothetical protein SAMN04488036_104289 [Shimia haliotis]
MRLLAFFATLIAFAGLILAGLELRSAMTTPLPPTETRAAQSSALQQTRRDEPQPPRQWPAVFGEEIKEEKQPPTLPTPPRAALPPPPPMPPIESLGYTLKGMVRTDAQDGTGDWAIVSHPTGDRLVRVGDSLSDGVEIISITQEGIWVDRAGTRALLGFEEQ